MDMTTTAISQAGRFTISEPVKAAWEHGNQFLVTSAAAFMSAAFSMQHDVLPWWIAISLAVGFEWTYLRGLANSDRVVRSGWATALNWSAMLTSIIYGVLYVLGHYEVIPVNPTGLTAIALALSHVLPMAVLSFCGANLRRVSKEAEVARNRKLVTEQDERNRREEDAATELRLETQRKEAELELYIKGQQAQAQLKMEVARNRAATKNATTAQPVMQPKPKREIVYNGVEYLSIQAAADAHGISRQAMKKRIDKEK
jgi:hypothetical protein